MTDAKSKLFGVFRWLPLRFGVVNIFFSALHLYLACLLFRQNRLLHTNLSWDMIATLLYSLFTLNLLVQLVNSLAGASNRFRLSLNLVLLAIHNLLVAYHFQVRTTLDYSVLVDNWREGFSAPALDRVLASLDPGSLVLLPVLVILFMLLNKKFDWSARQAQDAPYPLKIILPLALYIFLVLLPPANYDHFFTFCQSIRQYYSSKQDLEVVIPDGAYPLLIDSLPPGDKSGFLSGPPAGSRPNIFLVQIESFNQRFVEACAPDGREYTPMFNRLIRKGLYLPHFYGNSIQTSKGQFATFFSLIPSFRGKSFERFHTDRFRSLPTILREHGYRSIFLQASADILFDRTGPFLRTNGFEIVRSVAELDGPQDKREIRTWGISDTLFYRNALDYLGSQILDESMAGPLFTVLVTVANHCDFNDIAPEDRILFPEPGSFEEHYANSISLSDRHLETLLQGLESSSAFRNSILIITGDHGFPVSEHGFQNNQASYYEEFFRTPFLILWPGQIKPHRLENLAFSQMDIAPTILDMLEIDPGPHHFQGRSVFSTDKKPPVHLVQPYSGVYLGIVDYPYKYIWHKRTSDEFLYNLAEDPGETRNLMDALSPERQSVYRDGLYTFYLNQRLLELDRIFPAELSEKSNSPK